MKDYLADYKHLPKLGQETKARLKNGAWLGLPAPSKTTQKSIRRHYAWPGLEHQIRRVERRYPNRNLMVTVNSRKDYTVEPE